MIIKSQDDLNQPEKHSTDVLVTAIEECKKLKKQLNIAEDALKQYANESVWLTGFDALGNGGPDCMFYCNGYETAKIALEQIKELDK
nr:MAG TPA: hypothetical protein [Caudoviricetes sp.]